MKAAKRRILWTALSCGLALLEPGLFMLTLGSVCWGAWRSTARIIACCRSFRALEGF